MSEVTKELKEILTEQKHINRNIQFLTNGGIIITGLYNARNSENRINQVMGLIAACLALVGQLIILGQDIKECIDEPDEFEGGEES